MSLEATIAANRFGMGARPGELRKAGRDPKAWLIDQLQPVSFDTNLQSSTEVALALAEKRREKRRAKDEGNTDSAKEAQRYNQQTYRDFAQDTLNQAIRSEQSFAWRVLDFFSNHFSVSAAGPTMTPLSATLEREAIAPNLYGSFENLLLAVTSHPAMLIYLNNERSFGDDSRMGRGERGLNENLAREILELHTLGVNGGYTQADVIELAKGITGWSVASPVRDEKPGFIFREQGHEPGKRNLLGKKYSEQGIKQGVTMLQDLASHPSTIAHVCYKLAHHFVSDNPPESLVKKLSARWQETDGNIREVLIALVHAEEAWSERREKFKTPREFLISAYRAVGQKRTGKYGLLPSLVQLGQQPFKAGSPAGFSDDEKDWNGGSALIARIDWSATVAAKVKANAEEIMQNTLADTLSERTYNGVVRAESRQRALTVLLMSPEFQRR